MITKYADNETSGLIISTLRPLDKQPRVFEFYCVDDLNSECHHLINPVVKLEPKAAKVTGVSNEDLKDKPLFAEVADDIRAAIENCDEIFFHNASYDTQMLDFEFARLGQKLNWPRVRCSVEESEWIKGYRLKLIELHTELFGEGFEKAHGAKWDVLALRRCVQEMRKREWI